MDDHHAQSPTSRWTRWRSSRTGRALFVAGLGLIGLVAGLIIGGSTVPAETTTVVKSTTETSVTTLVKQRIVRKPPITIVHTRTVKVLAGGDNGFDYGNFAGQFVVRGLTGSNSSYGGAEVRGQISAPGGCEGYVQIDATFYKNGRIVETGITNFNSLPPGSWIPFSINSLESSMDSYDLVLTQADC